MGKSSFAGEKKNGENHPRENHALLWGSPALLVYRCTTILLDGCKHLASGLVLAQLQQQAEKAL